MDLAKRLAAWRHQPPEQWFGALNRYLPSGVTAILVVAIAYQLATLTWTLAPQSPSVAPPSRSPADVRPAGSPTADLAPLLQSHLFGEAQGGTVAAPVPTTLDAPETTLGLTLTGILFAGEVQGQAIISSGRGEEKTYGIGQTVVNADGATLHSVFADRVLLNRNGRLETLSLPKDLAAAAGGAPMPAPRLPRGSEQPEGSLRQVISENASRLTDILRLAPHVQEGEVIGFRLNPGRDRATFEALGLQSGDVVTDINGTKLNDPSQGLEVFESLGESTQANVTILREGVPQTIIIDTSQMQRLQENRE